MRMDSEDFLLVIAMLVILVVALYGISVPLLAALGT
jgi:hypothetical protein